MDLKDLEKGNSVVTTHPDSEVHAGWEICYVHMGSDLVGVGAFFEEESQCAAAIVTEAGDKKVIRSDAEHSRDDEEQVMAMLEEGYTIFNDQ